MALAAAVGALALLAVVPGASGAVTAGRSVTPPRGLPVVTSFDVGQFPEGLAVDWFGNRYVSLTTFGATESDPGTGQLIRLSPNGRHVPVGPTFDVGFGILTGVALDARGRLYVADASYQASTPPGVWRIERDGSATRVLTLTDDSFPNGLAFRGGDLYVSDSLLGVIWKVGTDGSASIWVTSPQLLPEESFGANGIAFWHGSLYIAVTDAGRIVRVPVGANGAAGTPVVIAERPELKGADGIAFDLRGDLYIATSSANTLLRLAPDGTLVQLASENDGLLYPTTPAFGGLLARPTTLYVANGDLNGIGTPNIVALNTGHIGLPLP